MTGGSDGPNRLPAFLAAVMARGLTVRAFANVDHPELRPAFLAEMSAIVKADPAAARVHVTDGIEQVPAAFRRLFTDSVAGKSLVRI
jgi:NADPH-dependent curcumin reductase